MMNKVQKGILDNVVTPAINNIAGMVIGEVRAFDSRLHIGTVVYTSQNDEAPTVKRGVPFAVTKGVKKSSPVPGDPVLLGFLNNSYQQPIILAILDKEYIVQTRHSETIHVRKGSGVPDFYSARKGESW